MAANENNITVTDTIYLNVQKPCRILKARAELRGSRALRGHWQVRGSDVHVAYLVLRARSRPDTGFAEPREQRSDSGRERKMEVRGGERLLYLAVLFGVFCAPSTLGKYVKGIVNTKEVSVDFTVIIFGLLLN